MPNHPPILIAEDEESDALLLRLAFERAQIPNPLVVAVNGRDVIRYLSADPPFADRAEHPMPALLLLDLKMPITDGFDVLEWLQARPSFKELPVVVLTSSEEPADLERARKLGASDYVVKQGDPRAMRALIRAIHARWVMPGGAPN